MAIREVRMPDGTVVAIDESLQWAAFSSFEANRLAGLDITIFSYLVGQRLPQSGVPVTGTRQATITDTNWNVRKKTGHDEAYLWYACTFEIFGLENNEPYTNAPADIQATEPIMTGTNLRLLQRDALYSVAIGAGIEKPSFQAPFSYYRQGIGAMASGTTDAMTIAQGAATRLELNYGTAGWVSPRNQRSWNLPVFVQPDRVVSAKMEAPIGVVEGLDQDYLIRWYHDGIKTRPIA